MLGCPEGILQSALQNKTIEAKGEKVQKKIESLHDMLSWSGITHWNIQGDPRRSPDKIFISLKKFKSYHDKKIALTEWRCLNFQMKSPLNKDQALYARDALAKGVYDRLFTWIVKKVNDSLNSRVSNCHMQEQRNYA